MLNWNPLITPIEIGISLIRGESENLVDETKCRQLVGSLRFLCNTRPDLAYGGLDKQIYGEAKSISLCSR